MLLLGQAYPQKQLPACLALILCLSEGRVKAVDLCIYLQRAPAVAGGGEFCCCPLFIQSESHQH